MSELAILGATTYIIFAATVLVGTLHQMKTERNQITFVRLLFSLWLAAFWPYFILKYGILKDKER